jgi:hypothetical protein
MNKADAEAKHKVNERRTCFCPIIKDTCRKDCRWFVKAHIQKPTDPALYWDRYVPYEDYCNYRYMETN